MPLPLFFNSRIQTATIEARLNESPELLSHDSSKTPARRPLSLHFAIINPPGASPPPIGDFCSLNASVCILCILERAALTSPGFQTKGSTSSTPLASKSRRFRVARGNPLVRAVAAMRLSLIGIGFPRKRRCASRSAQRNPVSASHGTQ